MVINPEVESPILLVGLAYSSEFIEKVLFGVNIINAVCKILEFAYSKKKVRERLY